MTQADPRRMILLSAALAGGFAATPSLAAPDPSTLTGIWTLTSSTSTNQCRMVLRTDAAGRGMALSLPPACRRAAPSLEKVRSWSNPDDGLVTLDDAQGNPVATFVQQASGGFQSNDNPGQMLGMQRLASGEAAEANKKGGPVVSLNPAAAGFESKAPAAHTPSGAVAAATPAAPPPVTTPKPTSAAEVAGNYAVMRGDRDTGCMVVLEPGARGGKGNLKARLAPACRDGGITVFDPIGWDLKAGEVVLTARKGHTVRLEQKTVGLWVKMPEDVKALGLKRL